MGKNSEKCENCENGENTTANAVADEGNQQSSTSSSTIVATNTSGNNNDGPNNNFNVNIIKQTVNSVSIDWNLMPHAEVYKIEKFHRRRGWEKVAWTSESPVTIEHLEENFGYRFHIRALIFDEEARRYVDLRISQDFVASTLALPPSTLSLYRAIKKGQQFLVKRILRRRPSLIEYPGPNGYLPLAYAIAFGEICIIDILLSAGASVHIGHAGSGRTPLHLAFNYGRLSVARLLLNKKADLEAADAYGMTPCHFAIDANQSEMLKFALESGANLEAGDACGWTLLLRAVVMQRDVGVLKMLIMHGANVGAVDKFNQSCVDLARLYRNSDASLYFDNLLKVRARDPNSRLVALKSV